MAVLERELVAPPAQSDSNISVKCRRVAAAIVHRVFQRYGDKSNLKKEEKPFGAFFSAHYATKMLGAMCAILNFREGTREEERLAVVALGYLTAA